MNRQDDAAMQADLAVVAQVLKARGWMLAAAESCTGGLIAAACTSLPGSSEWFERGFVSYSDASKTELLGVPAETIARHGAVSEEVVRAMAEGALARSHAQAALAVTGIAGPGGATPGKPVGTVWTAIALPGSPTAATRLQLQGDRDAVRQQTLAQMLQMLAGMLRAGPRP